MGTSLTENNIELPKEEHCPYIDSPKIIEKLLKDNYGLIVKKLKSLNGYDDRNYQVIVESTHNNPYIDTIASEGYFLKVSCLQSSRKPDFLNAQIAVSQYLHQKGIPCQAAVLGLRGEMFTECTTNTKDGVSVTYLVSLRTYLPGKVVGETTLTSQLLYNIGLFIATVTQALQDFHHPYYDHFDCLWSMNNIDKVGKATFAVKDKCQRELAEAVIEAFTTQVIPNRAGFRKGQIHGDPNEQNILVTEDPTRQICGLLDFEDSANSYPIYDLAMNVAYMMMTKDSEVPVLDIPGYVLAGYTPLLSLTPIERRALRTCVAARMAQSLVYGAYTFHLNPKNHYVLVTSTVGWQALQTLWAAQEDSTWKRWDEIVNSLC